MGNKRKASLIVATIFVVALGVFFGAYDLLTNVWANKNSDIVTEAVASNTLYNDQVVTLAANKTYLILFAGADGGQYKNGNTTNNGGYGAQCIAFYQTASATEPITINSGGAGSGGKYNSSTTTGRTAGNITDSTMPSGGKYTSVPMNFAMPKSVTTAVEKTVYAGGGGGAGSASRGRDATFGVSTGNSDSKVNGADVTVAKAYGNTATASAAGTGNAGGGSSGSGHNGGVGRGNTGIQKGTTVHEWYYVAGAGGGGGHYGGGGGGSFASSSTTGYQTRGGGGGGSCSPECYPLRSIDAVGGSASMASLTGAKFYELNPVTVPTKNSGTATGPENGSVHGNAGGAGKDVSTLNNIETGVKIGGVNHKLGTFIKFAYVYREKGTTNAWTTDITHSSVSLTKTAGGVGKKTIEWRYVVYGYSTKSGNSGTDYTTAINNKVYPCYNMKYTTAAAAAGDLNYVIASGEYDLTLKVKDAITTDPTVQAASHTYTGSPIQLLKTAAVSKLSTPIKYAVLKRSGNAAATKSLGDSTLTWVDNYTEIKAIDIGTYDIYYYAAGNGVDVGAGGKLGANGVSGANAAVLASGVTINAKAPTAVTSGVTKPTLTFNDQPQQLFTGAITSNSGGTVTYGIRRTNSSTQPAASNLTQNTSLSDNALKFIDSGLNATLSCFRAAATVDGATVARGNQIYYHLFYYIAANGNYATSGWQYYGYNTVAKAVFTIDPSFAVNSAVTYDGQTHKIASQAPTVTSTSLPYTNGKTVNTYLNFTFTTAYALKNGKTGSGSNNNTVTTQAAKFDQVNAATTSGTHTLKMGITAQTTYAQQITLPTLASGARTHDYPFTINQTANPQIAIKAGTFSYDTTKTIPNSVGGTVALFSSDTQYKDIDITVENYAGYNSIKSNDTTNNPNNYNTFAFRIYKNGTDVGKDYYATGTQSTTHQLLKSYVTNEPGTYTVKLKLTQHCNIVCSTTSPYYYTIATITVNGINANDVQVTGIEMSATATFDGTSHCMVKDTSAWLKPKDYTGTKANNPLGTVKYAVTTSGEIVDRPAATSTSWKTALTDASFKKTAAGKYYLWVMWTGTSKVTPSSGFVYGDFIINKLSDFATDATYFTGVSFSGTVNKTGVSDTQRYLPFVNAFTNKPITLVSFSSGNSLTCYYNGYALKQKNNDGDRDMGEVAYSISDSDQNPGTFYSSITDCYKPTDAGSYYLWIKWTGGNNVVAGQKLYYWKDTKSDAWVKDATKPLVRYGVISARTSFNGENQPTLSLDLSGFSTMDTSLPYSYTFSTSTGKETGAAQKLFKGASPVIKINGETYTTTTTGATFTYNANSSSTTAPADTDANWKPTVNEVERTAVGTYYLWVKVSIQDANVGGTSAVVYKQCLGASKSVSIVATTSFVKIAPKPKTGLVFNNGNQNLIDTTGVIQTAPGLHYCLVTETQKSNTTTLSTVLNAAANWKDASAIVAKDPGTYYVYYRGAKLDKSSVNYFTEQSLTYSNYPFIPVSISQVAFNKVTENKPTAKTLTYNGQDQDPFNAGSATSSVAGADLEYRFSTSPSGPFNNKTTANIKFKYAGNYTIYYKLVDKNNKVDLSTYTVQSIVITIDKIDITPTAPVLYGTREYRADDYTMIKTAGSFDFTGKNITPAADNTTYNQKGQIWYLLTQTDYTGTNKPADNALGWATDMSSLKARTVGTYYVWWRIDAGDNHNGMETTKVGSLVINPATDITFTGTTWTPTRRSDSGNLRYNGQYQNLVQNLTLKVLVAKRTADGSKVTGDSAGYKEVVSGDLYGEPEYLLANLNNVTATTNISSTSNLVTTGWKKNVNLLAFVNVNTNYHLYIKIPYVANSNIKYMTTGSSPVAQVYRLSALYTDDAHKIVIDRALWNDIVVSGITTADQMYTGSALVLGTGALAVETKVGGNNYHIEKDITEVQYQFISKGNSTIDGRWQSLGTGFASAINYSTAKSQIVNAGTYQLVLRLKGNSNIQDTVNDINISKDVIKSDVKILKADQKQLQLVNPVFKTDLKYSGVLQELIATTASVIMKDSGATPDAIILPGSIHYYFGENATTAPNAPKTNGKYNGQWNIDKSQGAFFGARDVGTYYIWVALDGGDNYEPMDIQYVGQIEIKAAKLEDLMFSNIKYMAKTPYTGERLPLGGYTDTTLNRVNIRYKNTYTNGTTRMQVTMGTGAGKDIQSIKYTYTNSKETVPSTTDESIWKPNVTDLKAIDADDYYIWIYVVFNDGDKGYKNIEDFVWCYQDTNTYTCTVIERATLDEKAGHFLNFVPHDGLVYIAQQQHLAHIVGGDDALGISFKNSVPNLVGTLNDVKLNPDFSYQWGWSNKVDTEPTTWYNNLSELMVTDAKDYYLWLWIPETKNFNLYKKPFVINSSKETVPITINKGTIKFIAEPIGNMGLIYNTNEQVLLSEGAKIAFYAKGTYYDAEDNLYEASGIDIQYKITNPMKIPETNKYIYVVDEWTYDMDSLVGIDAVSYTIDYRVVGTANWDTITASTGAGYEEYVVTIVPANVKTAGLSIAPTGQLNLVYNEKEQTLIIPGSLLASADDGTRGAEREGVEFVFYYVDSPTALKPKVGEKLYRYRYADGKYGWDGINGALPGRTNAGTYYIQWYLDTSRSTGNYETPMIEDPSTSGQYLPLVETITIEIAKRPIYWYNPPTAIPSLKYSGSPLSIVNQGTLNITRSNGTLPNGVWYEYSINTNDGFRPYDPVPTYLQPGIVYVFYRVRYDDNHIWDESKGIPNPDTGIRLVALIEKSTLSLIGEPQGYILNYNTEAQKLHYGGLLSTDDLLGIAQENKPKIEYLVKEIVGYDENGEEILERVEGHARLEDQIELDKVGKYRIFYHVTYEEDAFDFLDKADDYYAGLDENGLPKASFTAEIIATSLGENTVRAIYNSKTDEVYFEVEKQLLYNEERDEYYKEPVYNQILQNQFVPTYYYRKNDTYYTEPTWREWHNTEWFDDKGVQHERSYLDKGLGTYEFYVSIAAGDNIKSYKQTGDYYSFTVQDSRIVTLEMVDYNAPAKVRVWVDYTGGMTYNESPIKSEVYLSGGRTRVLLDDVNSAGKRNQGLIRVQVVDDGSCYYYLSNSKLSLEERKNMKLRTKDVENVYAKVNVGMWLEETKVYIYEVFKISYENNGAEGDVPETAYKWYGINYMLDENNLYKQGETASGWNTNAAGNGDAYADGSYNYTDNASVNLFAYFYAAGTVAKITVEWRIVGDNVTYALARNTNIWFDVDDPDNEGRLVGMIIDEGSVIPLPVVDTAESGETLFKIFNGYVSGWHEEGTGFPYDPTRKAGKNKIVYIAELKNDGYLICEFRDENETLISTSGMVAKNAEQYMALSGMTLNQMKNYSEGYNQFIKQYRAGKSLDASQAGPNGIITYDLGSKNANAMPQPEKPVNPIDPNLQTWDDYMLMFVIVGVGGVMALTSLVIYFTLRVKRKKAFALKNKTKAHIRV